MIPRLNISFSLKNQRAFWFGDEYASREGEYLLNHARSGIVMALRAALPEGGRVGVVAYNCHTVANAVVESGCTPVFVDVTEDLHVDVQHLDGLQLDAIVLTNLFGIHNDIAAVRQALGDAPIIVDNAHGYGLPAEGDFCVYSINQGKFPSLGEGGLLMVNNPQYQAAIDAQYADLKGCSMPQEAKLYIL
jgi:dTDP-4-amino-4,6-dideoxygalactose transaminase